MEHNILSAQYASPMPSGGYPSDALVIVSRANGAIETRCANDDIDGGGMLAFLAGGGTIAAYVVPAITADDVRAEAQRRILLLTGATTLEQTIIKQLNANMRANELNDIRITEHRAHTPSEAAEAAALRALADAIKAVRAASNVLEAMSPIPSDYTVDNYWP